MASMLNKRIIHLISLLCAIPLIISCASTAPLPSHITFIEPPPNTPPKLVAFFGTWEGKWYQDQDSTLVVERIDSDQAIVIFSLGHISVGGLTPANSFNYERGEVINDYSFGWSTANGNKIIFEMQDKLNEIKGYFIEASTGAKVETTMIRAKAERLSGINVHKYPYVLYDHPLKGKKDFIHDDKECWKSAEKKTILLSPEIRRFKTWEEVNRCIQEDYGWKPVGDESHDDIGL